MNVLPTFLSLALFSVAYDAPSDNGAYTSNQNAHSAGVAQAGLEILTFIQCIVVAKKVWARSSLEAAYVLTILNLLIFSSMYINYDSFFLSEH